jgi:hypothetical protein
MGTSNIGSKCLPKQVASMSLAHWPLDQNNFVELFITSTDTIVTINNSTVVLDVS